MIEQLDKLMNDYTFSNLTLQNIHKVNIPPMTRVDNITTMKDVCGFVIPIKGRARYTIYDHEYIIEHGKILHAGSSMKLSKAVVGNENWEYILLHYKIQDTKFRKVILDQMDYCINIPMDRMLKLQDICNHMLVCSGSGCAFGEFKTKRLLYEFISIVLETIHENSMKSNKDKIEYITTYIHDYLETNLSVEELSDKINMSPKQFYYYYNKYMGVSPKKYLMEVRMNKAKELINTPDLTIRKISEMVGYSDSLYFSRIFRKYYGLSPSDYRTEFVKNP